MELEHGKDFKTIFLDEPVKCFYASKIFWQNIDILEVEDKRKNGRIDRYNSALDDPEEVARMYVEQRYKDDMKEYEYYRDCTSVRSSMSKMPFSCASNEEEDFDEENIWCEPQSEDDYPSKKPVKIKVEDVIPMVKKKTVKAQMNKMVICCPVCHKIHLIEDFLVVKPEGKEAVESLRKRYGESWYSLCEISSSNVPLYNYLESIKYDKNGTLADGVYSFNGVRRHTYYGEEGKSKIYFSPKLICPECGCAINDYDSQHLSIFYKYDSDNTRLAALTIFNDEKKVAAVGLYRTYYINVDAMKISREEFRMRITFNTETGQSYFVGPKKTNGRKLSGWRYFWLMCITYRSSDYPPYIVSALFKNDCLKKEVFRALVKKFKGKKDQFKDFPTTFLPKDNKEYNWIDCIDFSKIPLSCITLYNRFHSLDSKQLLALSNRGGYMGNPTYSMKHLFAHVDKDASIQEILDTIIKNLHIPNSKVIRKKLSENLQSGCYLLGFLRFGFKDINIIQRFMDLKDSNKEYMLIQDPLDRADIKVFVKDMIARKGESKTFDSIFAIEGRESCARYLLDTARMYIKFKDADMLIKEYYRDNLYKIHQRMVKDYTKIRYANAEIKYSKAAESLNMTFDDGFEFVLAKDTNELVKIGQVMGICVGGYRDSALRGGCIIVAMKQNGKYVGCIELSHDMRILRQAKALYNNLLQERKAEVLKEWVETLNLNTDGCLDYQHIKNGDIKYDENTIYDKNYDYHHYELDDEGNVYDRNHRIVENNNDDVDDDGEDPFEFDDLPFL